ncbi:MULTISPECIES: glycosyltransferase family 2 protein [Winogradskyella]|uniref:Glycosyltransferase involved in cell wall bisynthesis n=1 Tax=Winogradskyella thalassocola TaxID=262004 RepID=A0A1G8FXY9_9FLAO|nr:MULTISPECIES: glycosyltransferase family 2 protein [Winogradskyella]SDH87024.1 Glycosyltransferase involved in cell wall bisynthesis [Winogradskyella thalassocola]
MPKQPLVSIIIPTFNRAHIIGETLDSIIEQTYQNWECIVVDDGSTDHTDQLLANYCQQDSRIQYHHRPKDRPKGGNTCRNYGFELSKGEYVNWFDSDDLYLPDAIKTISAAFETDTDVVISPMARFDGDTKQYLGMNTIEKDPLIPAYLVGEVAFYTDGPTWKRSFLVQQELLFDEDLPIIQDWDFNLRMLYQNPNIVFLKKAQINYRVHNQSLQKELAKLNLHMIASDFNTRYKHLELLAKHYPAGVLVLKQLILDRRKHFVKLAFSRNDASKHSLAQDLIQTQKANRDYIGVIKSYLGLWSYTFFGRGYWFFR